MVSGTSYSSGDTFPGYNEVDDVLSNLDVRLVGPDGETIHASSTSEEMNLEHIFFEIEEAAQYRIIVAHTGGLQANANYALAWWNGEAPSLPVLGDYNGNGEVDAADYVVWRNGGPLQNEVETPGMVTQEDYIAWRARFGNGSGAGGNSLFLTVPEPRATLILLSAVALAAGRRSPQRIHVA